MLIVWTYRPWSSEPALRLVYMGCLPIWQYSPTGQGRLGWEKVWPCPCGLATSRLPWVRGLGMAEGLCLYQWDRKRRCGGCWSCAHWTWVGAGGSICGDAGACLPVTAPWLRACPLEAAAPVWLSALPLTHCVISATLLDPLELQSLPLKWGNNDRMHFMALLQGLKIIICKVFRKIQQIVFCNCFPLFLFLLPLLLLFLLYYCWGSIVSPLSSPSSSLLPFCPNFSDLCLISGIFWFIILT